MTLDTINSLPLRELKQNFVSLDMFVYVLAYRKPQHVCGIDQRRAARYLAGKIGRLS